MDEHTGGRQKDSGFGYLTLDCNIKRNQKEIEDYLYLNSRGKRYTTAGFCDAIRKQCLIHGILDGEYVFKGCDYQKEFCRMLYRN